MQSTIFYEGWQMDCCGKPFSIGDPVKWNCNKYNENYDSLDISVDYIYEAHSQAKYTIIGKVIEIQAVTFEYQDNGEYFYPIGYTTQSIKKAGNFIAENYLVFLQEVEIKE